MDETLFIIRAKQALTMPESPALLSAYEPHEDIDARDRELLGLIDDAYVLVDNGVIAELGPWKKRSARAKDKSIPIFETSVLSPGLIDCHTHAVFAGERSSEFVLRNAGRPYVEILEAGGGILNTVDAVRQTKRSQLADTLTRRLLDSIRQGITSIEIKSGYGLTTKDEIKSLQAIWDAQEDLPCELIPCFLGAHAIPREYRDKRQRYIDIVCNEMIPQVAEQNLAGYCDVFCDRGAFSAKEAEMILRTGQDHGLIARIHADELSNAGAAMLAAEIGATSADHLEFTPDDAIDAMAKNNVVGVLMPAVNLFLGTTNHLAPARKLLNAGCEIALATDFNPGSAMTQDIGMMLTLGCTLYKLTPAEALRAVTIGAAKALGRDDIGRIRVGAPANLALFNAPNYRYLPYHFGKNHIEGVIFHGQFIYWTEETH